jgi:NADH-quinone oxidoreductase subunit L
MTSVQILLLLPFLGAIAAFGLGKLKTSLAFWVAEIVGLVLFLASLSIFMNYTNPIDIDYTWIAYGGINLPFGIYIDHLSVVMLLIATGLGFADIHFAHDYMGEDRDQARYYSKVLFFIGGMIILVIAKDLIGAFVGWEFMGLASYLLISFWFNKKAPADAGMQAFLYTRFGDIFILAAIGILWFAVGNLNMVDLNQMATDGSLDKTVALVVAIFIFLGAVGKSGQFPLYPWLMNAMEGPTTVSALIHGATMVNSGIYIVARLFDFYAYTEALLVVANVAALSAFIGATSALVQKEIKKILAYSTMSHLSIAFVGLGVGSLAAGMTHLMNHAIFKALLFLSAGAVIFIAHHTKDAWKLGGLMKTAPFVAIFMAMGSMSLAGIPPFSGFFSKDMVLAEAMSNPETTGFVSVFVTIAALLSVVYITRLWLLIFVGETRDKHLEGHMTAPSNIWIRLPLGILAFVTLGIALYQADAAEYIVGHEVHSAHVEGLIVALMLSMTTLFLIVVGIYVKGMKLLEKIASHKFMQIIHQVLYNGYYVEHMITWFSRNVVVDSLAKGMRWIDTNIIDWLVNATVPFAKGTKKIIALPHNGRIGDYMGIFAVGVAFIVIAILIMVKGV